MKGSIGILVKARYDRIPISAKQQCAVRTLQRAPVENFHDTTNFGTESNRLLLYDKPIVCPPLGPSSEVYQNFFALSFVLHLSSIARLFRGVHVPNSRPTFLTLHKVCIIPTTIPFINSLTTIVFAYDKAKTDGHENCVA